LPDAVVGIAAVIASFLTMYVIGARASAGASAAIVSAVLALTLARRAPGSRPSPWLTLGMLATVAVAAAFVGGLLRSNPVVGAGLFVAAIFLSIWLRQFGEQAARVGSLIALPFVVMLVVPIRPNAAGGPLVDLALVIGAALVAEGWTAIARFVAARIGVTSEAADVRASRRDLRPVKRTGPSVSTRMALQMGVALAAAFAIGFAFFREHWGWVVLTAFIVCSGARGRGDAAYKGLLRLGGALAGTAGAAVLAYAAPPGGAATAGVIFGILFLAMWLRERNYAYWAAGITLILALLQHSQNQPTLALLLGRLEGICIGALCAVVATWFVYPIRTEAVVRRRVAEVLAALEELFGEPETPAYERVQKLTVVEDRVAELDDVAPPVELHRRVFARTAEEHPAVWIGLVRELVPHARERASDGSRDGDELTRRAIRHSRRTVGRRLSPEELDAAGDAPITASLRRLRENLGAPSEA